MNTYRLYYPQNPLFGSDLGFKGDIQKMENDDIAMTKAVDMMEKNGWRYLILERKDKDEFHVVAEYKNDKFYVGCSPWTCGWFAYNCKETKNFGDGLEGLQNATEYARKRNEALKVK